MPSITINRKVVEHLVGKKLPDDKLADRISMLGTDLDSITPDEINVEIFPNRPDLLSEQGFARAFASFIGIKPGLRQYDVKPSGVRLIVDKSVKQIRPYTACAIVKGLRLDDEKIREIVQMQEKLHVTFCRNRKKAAIGVYPFEKITPPIRFMAKKPKDIVFRPLESDMDMDGLQILGRHKAGRAFGYLLDGLDKFPVFVDANDQVLSMPPIINSHNTGKVTENTKDVFVECSGFDFAVLNKCLNMLVCALADMGGQIQSMELEYPDGKYVTPNLAPNRMRYDLDYVNRRLGLALSEKEAGDLLSRMGYGHVPGCALVPAYRADVLHQVDLIEDMAIAYGYERFQEKIPKVATIGREDPFMAFCEKVARLLVQFGLIECRTYHLINLDNQTKKMNAEMDCVKIANPSTAEYNSLRCWMLPSLMEVLNSNLHREYPQKIFDIGVIFQKDDSTDTGVREATRLAVALACEDADYTLVRQVLDYLMHAIGADCEIRETEHSSFIEGRVGRVAVKGKDVAYVGEIVPEVLCAFGMSMPVAALELNLTELFEAMKAR